MSNAEIDRPTIERLVREVIQSPELAGREQAQPAPAGGAAGRVAMLVAKRKFEFRDFPVPQIADDEILVSVEACGICGTDVHCYQNDPFSLIPFVLGHEGTGEVLEVGSAWKMDSVGKPIRPGD